MLKKIIEKKISNIVLKEINNVFQQIIQLYEYDLNYSFRYNKQQNKITMFANICDNTKECKYLIFEYKYTYGDIIALISEADVVKQEIKKRIDVMIKC